MTSKDRILRIGIHKLHVISLLANANIRNSWANNMLLKVSQSPVGRSTELNLWQARLLSLLPHPLVTAFSIPPSRFPDRAQRARLFVDALQSLVLWWTQTFFDVSDPTLGQRTRPWDEVAEIINKLPRLNRQDYTPGGPLLKGESKTEGEHEKEEEERLERLGEGAGGERLRTVNSLMKKALQQEGSRDVSAVLFVALCRACGLGTRLVVSLQAVPWRAEKVVVKKPSGAGKGGRTVASRQGQGTEEEDDDGDESMEEVPIPGDEEDEGEGGPGEIMEKIKNKKIRGAGRRRQQDPAEVYRLRKPKPAVQTVGGKPKVKVKQGESYNLIIYGFHLTSRSVNSATGSLGRSL
jgi:xeroderma pigmentosum group C-complementing protein